jgi:hypothetical protein
MRTLIWIKTAQNPIECRTNQMFRPASVASSHGCRRGSLRDVVQRSSQWSTYTRSESLDSPAAAQRHGGRRPAIHDCAPGTALILEVQVLYGPMAGTVSRWQLRRSDAGWGGSRRQSSALTNRNRIRGRCGGVTRQRTGRPNSQSDMRTGKSGGDRAKDQCLTLGDLRVSPDDRSRVSGTAAPGSSARGHASTG